MNVYEIRMCDGTVKLVLAVSMTDALDSLKELFLGEVKATEFLGFAIFSKKATP